MKYLDEIEVWAPNELSLLTWVNQAFNKQDGLKGIKEAGLAHIGDFIMETRCKIEAKELATQIIARINGKQLQTFHLELPTSEPTFTLTAVARRSGVFDSTGNCSLRSVARIHR